MKASQQSNFTPADFRTCKPMLGLRDRGSEHKFSYLTNLIQISHWSGDFLSHGQPVTSQKREHYLQSK